MDFDSEQDIETEEIRSLTRRVARPLNYHDVNQVAPHSWPWQIFGVTKWQMFIMIWLLWQQTKIHDLTATVPSHGKIIGDLRSSNTLHAENISAHAERLSALSSQVEGLQRDAKFSVEWKARLAREVARLRAQMSECSCNAWDPEPDTCATCYHFSRNQSRNAHHEMQCQNGQCPDQPWLGWLTGIGSTFALFLLHSVSF